MLATINKVCYQIINRVCYHCINRVCKQRVVSIGCVITVSTIGHLVFTIPGFYSTERLEWIGLEESVSEIKDQNVRPLTVVAAAAVVVAAK